MPNGIDVGDAVLTFLGDTTQIDQAYVHVQGNAEELGKKIQTTPVVPPQVEESFHRVGSSGREATGEVALLGEATGIRLPRHVRSFVASLGGVNEVLTAAFSATAVLFLIQALVEGATKLSDFVSETYVFTNAMRESDKSVTDTNKTLVDLAKQYDELKKKVDDYGKSELQLAEQDLKKSRDSVKDLTSELKNQETEFVRLQFVTSQHGRETIALSDAYSRWKSGALSLVEAVTAVTYGETQRVLHSKELLDVENKVLDTHAKLKVANEQVADSTNKVTTAQVNLRKQWDEINAKLAEAQLESERLETQFRRLGQTQLAMADVIMPEFAKQLAQIGADLKLTGASSIDVKLAYDQQHAAVDRLFSAYQAGTITFRQFQLAELSELQAKRAYMAALGQETSIIDKQIASKQKDLGLDNQKEKNLQKLTQLEKVYEQTLQQTGKVSVAVSEATATAFGSAVNAYTTGSATIGQALAKIVQDELASIAERSTVKAIEELAYGFATLFTNPAESAAHFEAAALFGSIGAATAVAGRAIGGAANTSSIPAGTAANPVVTTSTSANTPASQPVQTTNAQSFASGAVVTKRTLAMVGDSMNGGDSDEGIIPLEDPQALQRIGAAIGQYSGGGNIHVHVQGLISGDNLDKVINKISKRVDKGQSHLKASNSLRLTRRG